ncbi:MAG: adaptor protein MecA [Clostridia bacterium]|nr:adaptor protein MecA [Clostridia bacterium]
MELILISNTKLKIMLSESDMRQYRIGSESDCAEPATRRAIRSLLEHAREQIGFNTEGEEIFVQLYTSKRGGCELFVTKCHDEHHASIVPEEERKQVPTERLSAEKRAKKGGRLPEYRELTQGKSDMTLPGKDERRPAPRHAKGGRIAFSFPDCESLLSVCKILNRASIRPESKAFADDVGNCYLLLLDTGTSAYTRLDSLTFILEYGERENPDCLTSYISEHGKVICRERAIETLCQL